MVCMLLDVSAVQAHALRAWNMFPRLPDNCAPYVIIYTGAQLSGSGAQLSGPGAQLSGPGAQLSGPGAQLSGAQLSAILVCIPTYVISAPLCMYCSSIYDRVRPRLSCRRVQYI